MWKITVNFDNYEGDADPKHDRFQKKQPTTFTVSCLALICNVVFPAFFGFVLLLTSSADNFEISSCIENTQFNNCFEIVPYFLMSLIA